MTVILYNLTVMINIEKKFDLDELAALVDIPKRTIRYYIQEGLVDRPEGLNRRAAYYTRRHLEQLLTIQKWQRAGVSLERIKELLRGHADENLPPLRQQPGTVEVWSHLWIKEGIELHIEPGQAGLSPEQVRALFQEVMELCKKMNNDTVYIEPHGSREENE
jgi:DNA-binding transcriptional MerR regulator